jgi:hypothetical protein
MFNLKNFLIPYMPLHMPKHGQSDALSMHDCSKVSSPYLLLLADELLTDAAKLLPAKK